MPDIPKSRQLLSKAQDEALMRKRLRDAMKGHNIDFVDDDEIYQGERCYLARRTAGVNLKDAAKSMGISHVALIKRERDYGETWHTAEYWGLSDIEYGKRFEYKDRD